MWEVTRSKLRYGLMDTFSAFLGIQHTIQHFLITFISVISLCVNHLTQCCKQTGQGRAKAF